MPTNNVAAAIRAVQEITPEQFAQLPPETQAEVERLRALGGSGQLGMQSDETSRAASRERDIERRLASGGAHGLAQNEAGEWVFDPDVWLEEMRAQQDPWNATRNMALLGMAAGGGAALSGALGGGAAGAGGTAGGSSGLSTIGLPAGVGQIPVTGGAGVVLPAAGSTAGGLMSMPPLSGAAGSSLGGSGLLSQINMPEGVGRISEGSGGGFMDRVGNFFGGGEGDGSMPGFMDFLGSDAGGALIGGGLGLLDSFMQPDEQTVTQQTQLPPQVQEALNFLLEESMGLQNAGSIVPELSDVTQQGIGQLSAPLGGPGFDALSGFASGNIGSDLSGVTDFVTDAATKAVGDRFSQAGRSGSPGEGMSLAKTITQNLSPFAFNARQGDLDRRLSAAGPLMNAQRQQGFDTLAAGGVLDEQANRRALEPFTRLDLLSGPLVSAISGAPRSTSTTQPLFNSPLTSALGGALTGNRLAGLLG